MPDFTDRELMVIAAAREIRDDDVVFVPLGETDPRFELAFTVRTGNRWGIGVAKHRSDILADLDGALGRVIADGRHRAVWREWLPTLEYPFDEEA